MSRRYRLYGRNRKAFFEGLQRFRDGGIPILIDGKISEPDQWIELLEIRPDERFYMMDLVFEEMDPGKAAEGSGAIDRQEVRDEPEKYHIGLPDGQDTRETRRLKEIRFDKVYNR